MDSFSYFDLTTCLYGQDEMIDADGYACVPIWPDMALLSFPFAAGDGFRAFSQNAQDDFTSNGRPSTVLEFAFVASTLTSW